MPDVIINFVRRSSCAGTLEYSQERRAKKWAITTRRPIARALGLLLFLVTSDIRDVGAAFCWRSGGSFLLYPSYCCDKSRLVLPSLSSLGSDRSWSLKVVATLSTALLTVLATRVRLEPVDRNASLVACAKQDMRKVFWDGEKVSRRSSLVISMADRNRCHFFQTAACSRDVFLCLALTRAAAAATLRAKSLSLAGVLRS